MTRKRTYTLWNECPSPYCTQQEERTAARTVALEISRRDLFVDALLGGCTLTDGAEISSELGPEGCAILGVTGYGTKQYHSERIFKERFYINMKTQRLSY